MWLKPQGYAEIVSPDKSMANLDHLRWEKVDRNSGKFDTATCNHCCSVFHVSARMRPEDIGGLCKVCMKIICPHCLDKPCTPFLKKLDEWEKREQALRSYGI